MSTIGKKEAGWHVEYGEGTKIKDADGNTVLWTQHTHLHGRRTDAEVRAIANLAAAAPDMVAALEHARHLMWEHGFSEDELQPIRAALSRAKGEA